MKTTKTQNKNIFIRIITLPFRSLVKAREFYVRSMTGFGERCTYGASTLSVPGGQFSTGLPKSFSTRSSSSRSYEGDDDFSELVRAASAARRYGSVLDVDKIVQDQLRRSATTTSIGARTSRQALPSHMGRIDEDAPIDFKEGGDVKKELYPRSRSYAVGKRSLAFV